MKDQVETESNCSTSLALQVSGQRFQSLVLAALERLTQKGEKWVARSQLLDLVDGSEATIKRALADLVGNSIIQRKGQGRSVTYALN